jgi:hypothetical protein
VWGCGCRTIALTIASGKTADVMTLPEFLCPRKI